MAPPVRFDRQKRDTCIILSLENSATMIWFNLGKRSFFSAHSMIYMSSETKMQLKQLSTSNVKLVDGSKSVTIL